MDRIRLILGSEDCSSRKGLTAIFSSESTFEVEGCFPLQEAIERSIKIQPDVVLLDIVDKVGEYEKRIRQLKEECPCSLVLVLINDGQVDLMAKLMALGIDGCIPKGIMRGCLVKIVELACRAGILCLPASAKYKVSYDRTDMVVCRDSAREALMGNEFLTKREMDVLILMAKNMSNHEIATTLFIGESTVKTHVSNILRKLKQENRAQAIIFSFKSPAWFPPHSGYYRVLASWGIFFPSELPSPFGGDERKVDTSGRLLKFAVDSTLIGDPNLIRGLLFYFGCPLPEEEAVCTRSEGWSLARVKLSGMELH